MATTITWSIYQLACIPQTPDGPNYVVTATWRCLAVDGQYTANQNGTCQFPVTTPQPNFVPYDQLTQDLVLGWCWNNGVDQQEVENAVQANLQSQMVPPIVMPPLPWA